jgi:hypothetical protein
MSNGSGIDIAAISDMKAGISTFWSTDGQAIGNQPIGRPPAKGKARPIPCEAVFRAAMPVTSNFGQARSKIARSMISSWMR